MNKYWKFAIRFIVITFLLAPLIIIAQTVLSFLYLWIHQIFKQVISPVEYVTTPTFWKLQDMAISETTKTWPHLSIFALVIACLLSIFLVWYFRRFK